MIDYDRIRDFYEQHPKALASDSDSAREVSEVSTGSVRLRRFAETRHLESVLKIEAGQRVLDLGAGTGSWSVFFAERGARVTGVERAPSLAESARTSAAQRGLDIDCRVGTLLDPPLLHCERFDILHIGNVLVHIDDADLEQVRVVVRAHSRPGSLLVLREPVDGRGPSQQQEHSGDAIYRHPERYRELFATDFRLLYERATVSRLIGHGRDTHSGVTSPRQPSLQAALADQLLPLISKLDFHLLQLEEQLRASRLRGFLGEPGVTQRFYIFARKYR